MIPMGNSEMNFWKRIFMGVDKVILCDGWRDPCLHRVGYITSINN